MMDTSQEYRNRRLEIQANLAAVLITLLGFVARLWMAHGIFLNPDEALHFRLANQSSLALAYRQSLTGLHPPLFILLLYLWRGIGTSDLWLRLPSVIAGTIFCWLFFKWMTQVAGRLAGLIGLMLGALLPPEIMLGAEVRQYALLLAFLGAALYFLERAFAENSASLMLASTLCLYLALLTHYSAFLFTGALGAYALSKTFTSAPRHPRASVIAIWTAGQLGALAVCLFLYKTHLSRHGFGTSQIFQGWMDYLNRSLYFESGRDNPVLFVVGHSFGVFQFLFGQLAVGIATGLVFLAGLGFILRGRELSENIVLDRRLAILLVLPFALACGASFLHIYPYGGTRHAAFLAIPAMAGVSVALSLLSGSGSTGIALAEKRWTRGLALTALAVIACIAFGRPRRPTMGRADQSRAHMEAAMRLVHSSIDPDDLIFTDYQTNLILSRYLCPQRPISFDAAPPTFEQFSCGGYRIVSRDFTGWRFGADNFTQEWQRFLQAYRIKSRDNVWIIQAGWDANLAEGLQHLPQFRDLRFESFGRNITVFKMTAGQPMASAAQ